MSTKKKSEKSLQFLREIIGEELTLGSFLHAIRQGEELSQVEFAKILGISKQYLCDIERGRRFVSPRAAEEFAIQLGYSSEQFVRLCLQDMIDRDGINLIVKVT